MSGGPHVGILFIGTGRYGEFLPGFCDSFRRHWFPGVRKTFFVYSDAAPAVASDDIVWHQVVREPWPLPTLHRYDYFLQTVHSLSRCSHLMFANANLRPLADVSFEEVFAEAELFGVLHPGYAFKWRHPLRRYPGAFETNRRSTACIGRGPRVYYAGGLNGGTTAAWVRMCGYLSVNIALDKQRRVNGSGWAVWHDESHINYYFNRCVSPRALGPEYLYPEGWSLPVTAKVQVLDKRKLGGHAFLRDAPVGA